jgi:hypothetical protein
LAFHGNDSGQPEHGHPQNRQEQTGQNGRVHMRPRAEVHSGLKKTLRRLPIKGQDCPARLQTGSG